MTMKNWPLVLVLVDFGGFCGFTGWMLSAFPEGLMWSYVAGGVALFAILTVCVLWRRRTPRHVEDTTPEDRPRLELPPGTRAERKADLLALEDGRLSLEEFIDRWSGRERVADANDIGAWKKALAASVLEELKLFNDPAAPALNSCTNCLGIHDGDACTLPAAAVEEKYAAYTEQDGVFITRFKKGQWVRVNTGGALSEKLVRIVSLARIIGEPVWKIQFGEPSMEAELFEQCLAGASPRIGEHWRWTVERCPSECWRHVNGDLDYFVVSPALPNGIDFLKLAREVRNGCLEPVNYGHGFTTLPRTGVEYVAGLPPAKFMIGDKIRVRDGVLADRIFTLKKLEDDVARVWLAEFGGAHEYILECRFILAFPKKGEVWNYKGCTICDTKLGMPFARTTMDIMQDWIVSSDTRVRINCGCFYRLGVQDKKQ